MVNRESVNLEPRRAPQRHDHRGARCGDRRVAPGFFGRYLAELVNIPYIFKYYRGLLLHAAGKITPAERTYIPEAEFGKVCTRARIYLLIYLAVIGLAIATRSILPLLFIGLPNLYGAWLQIIYGLRQHAGLAEDVLDHRLNTRTIYLNPINRFLYWNMGYHIEHHMFPMVPYHNLAKLHELMKADCPPPYNGLAEAYRGLSPVDPPIEGSQLLCAAHAAATLEAGGDTPGIPDHHLRGQAGCRRLGRGVRPEPAGARRRAAVRARRQHLCGYRTAIGRLYGSAGLCTHGNAQLADGFLQGTCIECPKHNGRFDIRDGSVRRPPPARRAENVRRAGEERQGAAQRHLGPRSTEGSDKPMKLKLIRHLWGLDEPSETAFPRSRPRAMPASNQDYPRPATRRASASCWQRTSSTSSPRFHGRHGGFGPRGVLQQPARPCGDLRSHAGQLSRRPGCGSAAEGQQFYEAVLAIERETPVPVAHETHRGRILYNPSIARPAAPLLRSQAQLRSQPLGVRQRAAADLRRGHYCLGG